MCKNLVVSIFFWTLIELKFHFSKKAWEPLSCDTNAKNCSYLNNNSKHSVTNWLNLRDRCSEKASSANKSFDTCLFRPKGYQTTEMNNKHFPNWWNETKPLIKTIVWAHDDKTPVYHHSDHRWALGAGRYSTRGWCKKKKVTDRKLG